MKPITARAALFCILLILAAFMVPAVAQEKEPTLKEAKAEFEKQDRALNAAWDGLKKEFTGDALAALKEEQRKWIEYRDEIALSPGYSGAPADEAKARQSPEYFSTAAALTGVRTEWLKALVAKDGDATLTGKYSDSYGAAMEIVEKEGKLYFSIDVVRGPTAHTGGIAGVASWNDPIGWFSDKGREKEKTDETNIAFIRRGVERGEQGKLEIRGANTSYYHGARAYFDGDYVRTGPLAAKAQAELVKKAKSP